MTRLWILTLAEECGVLLSPRVADLIHSKPDPLAFIKEIVRDIEIECGNVPLVIEEKDIIQWVKRDPNNRRFRK
jgi:hypothetical protein